MSIIKQLCSWDLLNRHPLGNHHFVETFIGSMVKVELLGWDDFIEIGSAKALIVDDAYKAIREDLVGTPADNMYQLTATQIAGLTDVPSGTPVYNLTEERLEIYTGSTWLYLGGAGLLPPVSFGEMYEDNDEGSAMDSNTHEWITATAGEFDPNGLITFSVTLPWDTLYVGAGGAGIYEISVNANFTNEGGKDVVGSIYVNNVEQVKLKDKHTGDSSELRHLGGNAFLSLADNDEITWQMVSVTPTDVVKTYQCNVNICRIA